MDSLMDLISHHIFNTAYCANVTWSFLRLSLPCNLVCIIRPHRKNAQLECLRLNIAVELKKLLTSFGHDFYSKYSDKQTSVPYGIGATHCNIAEPTLTTFACVDILRKLFIEGVTRLHNGKLIPSAALYRPAVPRVLWEQTEMSRLKTQTLHKGWLWCRQVLLTSLFEIGWSSTVCKQCTVFWALDFALINRGNI